MQRKKAAPKKDTITTVAFATKMSISFSLARKKRCFAA
jgi:ribosomal protein S25